MLFDITLKYYIENPSHIIPGSIAILCFRTPKYV